MSVLKKKIKRTYTYYAIAGTIAAATFMAWAAVATMAYFNPANP